MSQIKYDYKTIDTIGPWQGRNYGQLDLLGEGAIIGCTWDNPAAPIIKDLLAINAAFKKKLGVELSFADVGIATWGYIITNDEVAHASHGVGEILYPNSLLDVRDRLSPESGFRATLRAIPWIVWNIVDEPLELCVLRSELTNERTFAYAEVNF